MEGGTTLTQEEKNAVMQGIPLSEFRKTASTKSDTAVETKNDAENDVESEAAKVDDTPIDLSVFKKFGKEIESEDALKSLFEKADKYDETRVSHEDAIKRLDEYKNLSEKLDPMSNFLNEDEYKRQQLLIKRKDELSDDAIKALSVLTPSKVKELSDQDALKTQLMIDKGLSEKKAELYLLNKYGIEDFSEGIDEGIKTAIEVDAIDARRNVAKVYDGIEIPTKVDYETARVQLKESWERPIPELIKSIDKIQIAEGLDFVVTDEMKAGLAESTMNWVMSKQMKPSEAAGAEIIGMVKDQLILKNIDKLAKSIVADTEEKMKAANRAAVHNDRPLNEGNRTTVDSDLDNDAKMSKMF